MSKTTTNLQLPRRWFDLPTPAAATICIFALLAIATLVGKIHSAQQVAAVPTPALAIIIATNVPTAAPTPAAVVSAVLPNALRRAVVAWDAPNGNPLGAIEQGRAYSVLARFGSDWLQADVTGSGIVWLRSADVLDLPAGLADLQPAPQPQVVYVSAPAYAVSTPTEQEYQVANEPQPTPVWATSAPVRPEDFVAPDPKARCAFVGCL